MKHTNKNTSIFYRQATIHDSIDVKHCIDNCKNDDYIKEVTALNWIEDIILSNRVCYIAIHQDNIVGYYIDDNNYGVLPEYRHQGIAHYLKKLSKERSKS